MGSERSLAFWADRLATRGYTSQLTEGSVFFTDDDGLSLALVVAQDGNPPLRPEHPAVPAEHAILGVGGARAFIAGFAVDEDLEDLGEQLRLPRQHEHLRPQLERHLTPIINPRAAAPQEA